MRMLVERVVAAAFIAALSNALLPPGRTAECARRAIALIGLALVIRPILLLLSEAL